MTRDDVIRLAREVGADVTSYFNYHYDEPMVLFHPKELEAFAARILKEHSQQVINDPAEIRRVFEIDDAEYPPPDSGFAKL